MLYLDFAIYKEEMLSKKQRKLPMFMREILYCFKKLTGQVYKYKIDTRTVIVIPKINKKIKRKIDRILKIDVTKNICVCDELMRNEEFMKYLNEKSLNIIDGRWLFQYMMFDIIKYICNNLRVIPENQEITILTNENNLFISENIKRLADNIKNINIITRERNLFKKLEDQLYKEKGLIVNISNNFKKSALKSNIIYNLNFVQEDFNKITFPKDAVIVSFETSIKMNQKNFKGINSNFFCIDLPSKYKEIYRKLTHFSSVNLYESLIYKKTSMKNIWKEIEDDEVEVVCLEDENKIIKFNNEKKDLANI